MTTELASTESATTELATAAFLDTARFRRVLGHFCTGVTVVTAAPGGDPVGFACQSFSSLSLDPPLVLFCPATRSRTWPVIERAGSFCVNVLSQAQQDVSTVFGTKGADKFSSLAWTAAPSGAPVLDGVLTWIDCTVEAVHPAGDHYVVIGRVTALGEDGQEGGDPARPLLFYRGRYTGTEPESEGPLPRLSAMDPDTLLTWPRPDDWL